MTQNHAEGPLNAAHVVASKNKVDVATELRQRIGHILATRRAPRGTLAAKLEDRLKEQGGKLWAQIKKHPALGVVLVSGGTLAIASTIGVGEVTLTLIVGYAAYQVFREGVPPKQAAEEALRIIER